MRASITASEFRALPPPARRNKYGAHKVVVDGLTFHSKGESVRWAELKVLERAGEISKLQRQQPFPLKVNGQLVTTLVLDFTYEDKSGAPVFEDFKGVATDAFKIKAKLFRALTGHEVRLS